MSFSDTRADHDTEGLLQSPIEQESRVVLERLPEFIALKTHIVAVVQIILVVAFGAEVFILPWLVRKKLTDFSDVEMSVSSVLLLSHVLLSILFLMCYIVISSQHSVVRRKGYLAFYSKTRKLIRYPLYLLSFGNAVFLVESICLYEIYLSPKELKYSSTSDEHCRPRDQYDLVGKVVLQVTASCELVLLLILIVRYLVMLLKFNSRRSQPDVIEQDLANTAALAGSLENGFRDETLAEDLIEKQAEMIRYLQEHNQQLAKRVLALTNTDSA